MNRVPTLARVYIALVVIAGACLLGLVPAERKVPTDRTSLIMLGAVMALAAVFQVWKVEGTTAKTSYNLGLAVFGFTLVVLGPASAILAAVFASLLEWVFHRYPWYIQTFNVFCLVVGLGAFGAVYRGVLAGGELVSPRGVLAVVAATACFVLLNHLMVGLAILLARGERFSHSGVFARLSLLMDFTLFATGAVGALLWFASPYAALLLVISLYMLSVTLKVPSLERQATTDGKTGLFNARYFQESLERELSRANRFGRPLTVVIGDLDLLRNINNTYGHLAGDQVLAGISQILKDSIRGYDVVARFGGEEFSILMPETFLSDAVGRVEQLRQTIEATRFEVATSVEPIQVTMSFGMAERAQADEQAKTLLHRADVALYRAKLDGRNLVRLAAGDDVIEAPSVSSQEGLVDAEEPLAVSSLSAPPKVAATDVGPLPAAAAAATHETGAGDQVRGAGAKPRRVISQSWRLRVCVVVVGIIAVAAFGLSWYWTQGLFPHRWYDLALFAFIALLAESLAIDIYVRDTSVSTSGAPFLAAAMLFGPLGALVLSLVMAGSAFFKHHSSFDRLTFNASSHLIAGLAAWGMTRLVSRVEFVETPWLQVGLAIVASMILFVVTSGLISAVMSLENGKSVSRTWKDEFSWLWPYYVGLGMVASGFLVGYQHAGYAGVVVVLAPLFVLRYAQAQYIDRTKDLVSSLRDKNRLLEGHAGEISRLNEELLVRNEELLVLVSSITDFRDPYMGGHSEHVSRYATLIGQELGLSRQAMETVRKAALLHDIGKLGIRQNLLAKPSSLTESEYQEVKAHVRIARDMLAGCQSLSEVVGVVCDHHENYDGSGYPAGVRGDSLSLESRILRVADSIEAMASDRPYRRALSPEAILEELRAGVGRQYDRSVVEAVLRVVESYGRDVITNSAEEVRRRDSRVAQPAGTEPSPAGAAPSFVTRPHDARWVGRSETGAA